MRGTEETYTTWIPLGDCPRSLGSLQIVPASHLGGLRLTQPTPDNRGMEAYGASSDRWIGGEFAPGDILIFHSLTVHRALPNRTDRLRLSVDFRYQPLSLPIHPTRFALTDGYRSWESTYDGWVSSRYQYYWQNLRLHLAPSIGSLVESLMRTDDPRQAAALTQLLNALVSARLARRFPAS
jgi:ectoine hydroxylase-related dioxygenase (phytanoyl-CoA dioxygenase family)